jgi:hypothetical protein
MDSVFEGTISPALEQADRAKGLSYLAETRDAVVNAAKGLTEEQWMFKPSDGAWSIADVVEHLARLEDFFQSRIVTRLRDAPAGPPERDYRQMDALILVAEPDPTQKGVIAGRVSLGDVPPPLVPAQRWSPRQSLARFLASREETAVFLLASTGELRAHVVEHPALGMLDGYQWVLFIAAHTERHTRQIVRLKADPRFPAA